MHRLFPSLRQCRSGIAVVEFALILPLLILMLIATIEFSRYAILNQKLDKSANAMADFTTQGTTITPTNLDVFSEAVGEIMEPFSFSGTVIFSSVTFFATPDPPCSGTNAACISWQYAQLGSDSSLIGTTGSNATLPAGYTLTSGQNVIVAEVFYNYAPLLPATGNIIPSLSPHQLYKVAVYKPRIGTLTELD